MSVIHYCTYFDQHYLSRGLAAMSALAQHAPDRHVWVLAADDTAYRVLQALSLPTVTPLSLRDLEDDDLRAVKPTRSRVEYLWTLTPVVAQYVLQQTSEPDIVAYLDADCWFTNSDQPIWDEATTASIIIHEHRFSPEHAHLEARSGKYNVGLVAFRRDHAGIAALQWWRERCLEWCYREPHQGKMGDQMYLNDWPSRFNGVHVLQYPGAALGPWNINNHKLAGIPGHATVDGYPILFYHYHAFHYTGPNQYTPARGYPISAQQQALLYEPYRQALDAATDRLQQIDPTLPRYDAPAARPTLITRVRKMSKKMTARRPRRG